MPFLLDLRPMADPTAPAESTTVFFIELTMSTVLERYEVCYVVCIEWLPMDYRPVEPADPMGIPPPMPAPLPWLSPYGL